MGIKVLIVEDEMLLAMTYQMGLEKNHTCEVIGIIGEGQEAIKEASKSHPDVILMDITLKGDMDGIEAVKKIKEELQVPVIYITGNTDEKTKQRALATRPIGYFEKPVETETLCRKIKEALGSSSCN